MQINERVNMLVTDEVRSYIGLSTKAEFACDAVESGAVIRYRARKPLPRVISPKSTPWKLPKPCAGS